MIEIEETRNGNCSIEDLYIQEIKRKISMMRKSKYRTTNFSLIEYFVENNFNPLKEDALISKILADYKSNPRKYILSKDKTCFKTEKSFKSSVKLSILKNKSFSKGPRRGELTLNLENTYKY